MRIAILLPVIALMACTAPEPPNRAQADLDAIRQVTMSGPSLSWEQLRIHPGLMRRACSVSTLVTVDGDVVGYCRGGRQCRTNDWRPVEAGCNQSPEYRAEPSTTPAPTPPTSPGAQPAPSVDLARMR